MTATATAVVDLGFGDAGKGSITDALVRERRAEGVVRFNGGCQAAHRVVDPNWASRDGMVREHIFAQFGSGTLAGAATHLSRFMMIEPQSLQIEAEVLERSGIVNPFKLLTVDPRCLVTTPLHKYANQAQERSRGDDAHGSCGRGIGETIDYMLKRPLHALRAYDLLDQQRTDEKLQAMMLHYSAEHVGYADPDLWYESWEASRKAFVERVRLILDGILLRSWGEKMEHVVFEGAQGVLIDEKHGFAPYHTWSNCTFDNALELAAEAEISVSKMGVTRAYMVRHGPGPLPTEDGALSYVLQDDANVTNDWQGRFRVGWLDVPMLSYAVRACGGIDELAVTNLDRLAWLDAPQSRGLPIKALVVPSQDGSYPHAVDVTGLQPRICVGYTVKSPNSMLWPTVDYLPYLEPHEIATLEPVYEPAPLDLPESLGRWLDAPVTVVSNGPSYKDKVWLAKVPS